VVVFGTKRLPEAARMLGAAVKEFLRGLEVGSDAEDLSGESD